MQGVNVFENGIGYLLKCLNMYTGGTGFFAMYLIAVAFILIKGDRRERELFLYPAVVLILTVFNPVVPIVLDRIFDVSSEYYRLFWIAPVIVAVPYVATKFISSAAKATVTVSEAPGSSSPVLAKPIRDTWAFSMPPLV